MFPPIFDPWVSPLKEAVATELREEGAAASHGAEPRVIGAPAPAPAPAWGGTGPAPEQVLSMGEYTQWSGETLGMFLGSILPQIW